MNNFILLLLASIGLAFVCGCDGSVSLVKNGTIGRYSDVTIGKAFNASFDNAKWKSATTEKGRTIVCFTGKINQKTHDAALKSSTSVYNALHNYITNSTEYEALRKLCWSKKTEWETANQKKMDDISIEFANKRDKYSELCNKHGDRNELKLLDEEVNVLGDKLNQYGEQKRQLMSECGKTEEKFGKEFAEDFKKNSYWPVGQDVEFNFIVYPDGKNFEIDSFSNESWANQGLPLESVLKVIFAD